MFIRTKPSTNKTRIAIQIVENYRVDSTIKQRVIRHIGTGSTSYEVEKLKELAQGIKTQMEHELLAKPKDRISPTFGKEFGKIAPILHQTCVDLSNIEEESRLILGIHDIYGYIYETTGFKNLFTRPKARLHAAKVLREIVLGRIAFPGSKRMIVDTLNAQFGVDLKLDQAYKMMDKIDETFCNRVQQCALSTALSFTGGKLQVLFYDATTLYFESFIEDELKQNGYSKDMKFNQAQVLLALFVTNKGLPVGYELFPGAMYEGHTLIPVLNKLKSRYALDEIIVVADRGLLSEENITHLQMNGFRYILGARIKNLPKALRTKILDDANYDTTPEGVKQTAIFKHGVDRSLIVNYSHDRASKDQHDREKAILKLQKKLSKSKDPKSLLNNYGYKKYLEVKGDATLTINQKKLEDDAQWDGLLGVMTNIEDPIAADVLAHYRGLWQIEECFRIKKHDLRIRPIYHWTPKRIRAHVAITFMSFVCVRHLEYRLASVSKKISPEEIRRALLQVQGSVIKDKISGNTYLLLSRSPPSAKEIYRVIGIKMPTGLAKIKRSAF